MAASAAAAGAFTTRPEPRGLDVRAASGMVARRARRRFSLAASAAAVNAGARAGAITRPCRLLNCFELNQYLEIDALSYCEQVSEPPNASFVLLRACQGSTTSLPSKHFQAPVQRYLPARLQQQDVRRADFARSVWIGLRATVSAQRDRNRGSTRSLLYHRYKLASRCSPTALRHKLRTSPRGLPRV